MEGFFYATLLAPALPLVGAFWNRKAALIFGAVAGSLLLGVAMNAESEAFEILVAQVPLLILLTMTAWTSARNEGEKNLSLSESVVLKKARDLGQRHRALKEEVASIERDETRSLQIYGAAKSLAEALSWKDMAPRLTTSVQRVFGGYEFTLFAFNEDGDRQCLHRRGGWSSDFPLEGDLPNQATLLKPPQTTEVVPVLSVPIYSGQGEAARMNGALFLKSPGSKMSDDELVQAGEEFGAQLGMAIDKALLFSQMEQHSQTDGLTGLLRRQAFMDRLEEEFKRAAVFQTPFSLLMVDVDFFKSVNDSHGHEAGDAVLKRLGEILKESFYETDVVGRYGGEEFIILLPKAEKDGVLRKAESLRARVERESLSLGFERIQFTISVGVAHFPDSGAKPTGLIEAADQALYRAKETGRNRVVEA